MLLFRLTLVCVLGYSGGKQCDAPSNEIVWLKVFAWIDCRLMEEFATSDFTVILRQKESSEKQTFSCEISMR